MTVPHEFATAVKLGDSNQVESLLSLHPIEIDVNCPLVEAAKGGHARVVELLIDHGARVDDLNAEGMAACHAAARNGHSDVLAVLIARNANVGLRDVHNFTALELAVHFKHPDATAMLIAAGAPIDGDNDNVLCMAAGMSTAVIQALIDRGVVISSLRSRENETPCHHAAVGSDVPAAIAALQMLVQVCGVDLNVTSRNSGSTCVHYAAWTVEHRVLRWLIAAGADIQGGDVRGRTPLLRACAYGRVEKVALLLAAGADVHVQSRYRESACLLAVRLEDDVQSRRILHMLIAVGASLNLQDHRGYSALGPAMARGLASPSDDELAAARQEIARAHLSMVIDRAFQVCVGLQSLELAALQLCEILPHACGPLAATIPFHRWWQIATMVKHFREKRTGNH